MEMSLTFLTFAYFYEFLYLFAVFFLEVFIFSFTDFFQLFVVLIKCSYFIVYQRSEEILKKNVECGEWSF